MPIGVTRGLSQWESLAEGGPLTNVGDQLANTQRKTWEMIVNPDFDVQVCTFHDGCKQGVGCWCVGLC